MTASAARECARGGPLLAVDLGGTHLRCGIVTPDGTVRGHNRTDTPVSSASVRPVTGPGGRPVRRDRRRTWHRRRHPGRRPAAGTRSVPFIARGTSDNAAVYGSYLLQAFAGRLATLASPSIATAYRSRVDLSGVLAVALSQSGQTAEIIETLTWARDCGARTLAITNAGRSAPAETAELAFVTRAGAERAVPATKTFTTQLAALAVLAIGLGARLDPGELRAVSALSLDALSSVAYGPEAILAVLAAAGAAALHLVLPVTVVIVALLTILVFSYRQVIDAYPGGGGSYAVSRANFPPWAGLLSAASLVVDYTLTVAVSISAGVAALASAFPVLGPVTVPVGLGILAVITLLNLRGLGDTARAFLLPTAVFIADLLAVIAVGLIHPLALHAAQPGRPLLPAHPLAAVSVLLLLKAFSAGCSALTGVEAIANGVPLFRQPRQARAKRTELLLGVILGLMLLGLAVLARRWHLAPRSGQTVLSQIMATAVGRH